MISPLNIEQLTYLYETLHDRKTSNIDSKKNRRMCETLMSSIEREILLETGENTSEEKS